MGSTSSNCCEMFDKEEEPTKPFNNLAKPNFHSDETASFETNNIMDPRSPSSFIPRTPLAPLPSIVITPEYSMSAVTTDNDEIIVSQSKAPEKSEFQTPSGKAKVKIFDDENAILDPRSPSNSISRTPIANKEGHVTSTMQGVIDPRSPSVEINRTPIIKVVEEKDLKDPRSPSNGIERTPLKLSHNESLRRNVLLTNTLNASPGRPLEEKEKEETTADKLEVNTLSPFNLSSLSYASILDVSRSSSARATCGSEDPSPNTSMEEFQFFQSPATVFDDSKVEDQNDPLFSKTEVDEIADAIVKRLITEIVLVGDEDATVQDEKEDFEIEDAESSLPSENHKTGDVAEIVELDQVLTEFQSSDPTESIDIEISCLHDGSNHISPLSPVVSSDMSQLHGVPQPSGHEKTQEEDVEETESIELLDSNDIKVLEASLFSGSPPPADAIDETKNKSNEVAVDSKQAEQCTGIVVVETEEVFAKEKSIKEVSSSKPLVEIQNVDGKNKAKSKSRIPSVRRKSEIIKPFRAQKALSTGSTISHSEFDGDNQNQIPFKAKNFDENQAKQIPTKLHRHVLEKKGMQMGKQQTRSPLSVLGHNNSPEARNDLNRSSNKSRVPRYRGTPISKTRSMSVASTSSLSPKPSADSHVDKYKYGKEN